MGLTDINFQDRVGQSYQVNCLSLPLGIGIKYLCDENLAIRLDLLDDIAMSNEHLVTQNNFSITGGLELASAAAGRSIGRLICRGNHAEVTLPVMLSRPRFCYNRIGKSLSFRDVNRYFQWQKR